MAAPEFISTNHPLGIAKARIDAFNEGMPNIEVYTLYYTKNKLQHQPQLQALTSREN